MRHLLVGSVAITIASLFFAGCGSADSPSVGQTGEDLASSAAGENHGLEHVYARPDMRECPSPACGGSWLVAPTFHNACHDQPSETYVAGIYAGNEEVSPPCNELLTGTVVRDPRDPQFNIFLLEL